MALAGNGFADNTLATTQQQVACKGYCRLTQEINDPDFLLLVADSLNRLGVGIPTAGARISNITEAEQQEAVEYARCVVSPTASLVPVDPLKTKALILAQLNELLVANT